MTTPDRHADAPRTWNVPTPTEEQEPTTATSEHPDEYTPAADPLTVQHPFHESAGRGGEGSASEPATGGHAGVADPGPSEPPSAEPNPSTTGTGSGTAVTEPPAGTADTSRVEPSSEPSLFADGDLAGLRARWNDVQAGFVDDPRACVQKADGLVSDVVTRLTSGFTEARSRLEHQWGRGEEASTEDLRVALTRYREFFERLLAV
jgi:hypothetical protein